MKSLILALTLVLAPTLALAEANECSPKRTLTCPERLARRDKELASMRKEMASLKAKNEALSRRNEILEGLAELSSSRVVEKETIEHVIIDRTRKNAINLIVPVAATKLEVSKDANNNIYEARTKPEADIGLMFQHDFSRIRGTFGITGRGSAIFGVGYAF